MLLFLIKFEDINIDIDKIFGNNISKKTLHEIKLNENEILKKLFIEELRLNINYKFLILHDYLVINSRFIEKNE